MKLSFSFFFTFSLFIILPFEILKYINYFTKLFVKQHVWSLQKWSGASNMLNKGEVSDKVF
jgi:hypothetical protein